MASSAEPPPKKRRLVDAKAGAPSPSSSSLEPPAPASPQSPVPPPPGVSPPPQTLAAAPAAPAATSPPPDEAVRKRRNREELRGLFECYRRIRLCVERKDALLLPELEQVYLSLIASSRGCTSVQRILADLIPQYASYCPTALEAATKVSMNMYKFNLAIVTRREDVDGVAYQTARACILGLTDICSTASFEAPKSSVLTGICSAVYMTVLTFFISTFDGKDIYHIGSRKLLNLQDPVGLLDILKQESEGDNRKADDCLIELRALSLLCIFLLFPENVLDACFALIASAEDVKGGLYFLKQLTCHLNSDIITDALDVTDRASQCTRMDVDQPDTNESVDSKLSSHNVGVLGSSTVQPNDCYMTMVSLCLKVLGSLSQLDDDTHMGSESSVPDKTDENSEGFVQPNKPMCSSEQKMLLKTDNIDSYGGNSVQNKNGQVVHNDDVKTEKLADVKPDVCKQGNVISDAGHQTARVDMCTPKSTHDSAGGATSLTSPGQNLGKTKQSYSEPSDLYGAHFSRDVISVSKELWIGSLGNSAAESLVRSKFEEFGPLANFLFYPPKNFALVEYRNIMHAVHAYGCMQGSSVWGGGLQIRYLDRLIGSRGFASGIAVGESRHIYVAKVKNKKDKDEVFDELKAAGLKKPCSFTDISSENALLLEFETATDAAAAKAHIRRQLHSDVCSQDKNTSGHQLLVRNIDNIVPDMEFINAFSRFGEVIRWQFNKLDGICLIDYRSNNAAAAAKSHLHGARFGQKSISVESRTCNAGSVHDKTLSPAVPMLAQSVSDSSHHETRNPRVSGYNAGFTVPTERPIYGPSPPRGPQSILPCPPISAHRGSVIPPPPIQTSFVRPVYPGPGSPWENTTPNPPFSHASPRMMPGSSFRMNPPAPLPFIPSSVTPLSQFPGGSAQQLDKRPPPPPPNVGPPPFTRLDPPPPPPPSPPPLPITQPPSVPPPPNSPPMLQPSAEPSDSQKPYPHPPRWQGSLSKSGLHFCTIYASRIELDACRYEHAVSEPAGWPSKLDVTKRTDYQHVKTTFSNTPPSKREVCRLLPCSNSDHKGFRDFISYLKQRECAGVIKIPSVKPLWSRLLFILPPTPEACGMLELPPHPSECLIALILPKETTAEAT
uniref:RRM domain-containing protein n=1 Tax=Leersia perrieri TaxID=77586 RepID=A0A0D9V634_9ORYZ